MSLISAELAATCNALGYYDEKSNKYYADSNTLETVKDLIRYLRKDDESHDVRRQLGVTKILQTDLLPLLKSYWEETDLFDVLLRLLVNLTTPPLMLWNEEIPTDKTTRNYYLQIEDHLKSYKQAFADETFWAVLSTRLSRILETDYSDRGDDNSLVIERILILIRNILYVPPDPYTEKRPDNDASVHDQVLFALHQSGMLDIILYITSAANEKAYYMHTLEILSFMLREQKATELATAALQRSEMEKIRDEAELLAIRHKETNHRQQQVRKYNGARHSRFGGTFVLKSMKSISDNELIYHKPLDKLDALNFDVDKKKNKTPKNRLPVQGSSFERRSTFTIRLFLKEFCVEFLNGAYNTLMYYVKDNLVRAKAHAHDESYYLWALRFFMEFNRCYKFEVKLVSETMSTQTFRYAQQLMETYFDMIRSDKKKWSLWSRRLHLALLAYRELLLTISVMDKSPDGTVRDSAKVIKNNVFYILEYREFIITLLITYDELKMSNTYLKDLMETQHIFLKMLESFCGTNGSVVVQKKTTKKRRKKKAADQELATIIQQDLNLQSRWDEAAPQLSIVLEGNTNISTDAVPFDAASDVPIDEQKSEAMKNVQRKLRNGEFENAISLLRAAREVWPENDCFGSNNMATEEEFLALREIFFADLGENEAAGSRSIGEQQPIYEEDEDEEDEEENYGNFNESDFKFEDFAKRVANPKVVRACGLALKDFESNSVNTNHCIIKLLHRIAFDCKLYVMVFQISLFRTFQKIYCNKDFPQYRELVKFATYIIRQFMKVAQDQKKVYMEALFWKRPNEAYEIEHGYAGDDHKAATKAWTEEQEDELQRLFNEHQQNQLEEDIVDWIVNNLIDNTRSRRGVLKKLKEMCLLSEYKGRRKSGVTAKIPHHQWGAEEEIQLRELYEHFKGDADPLGCIMARLNVSRSKPKIVQKLLDLGLIHDKAELRKKRTKKSGPATDNDSENNSDLSDSHSEDGDDRIASFSIASTNNQSTTVMNKKAKKKVTSKTKRKSLKPISYGSLAKYLINLVNLGMNEPLEWIKESFSDAIEDFESGDNAEGIPLVPIMDYAIDAMESLDFQMCLKALGICEPLDEQESYWRIPGDFSLENLHKNVEFIEKALDKTLTIPEEQPSTSGQQEKYANNEKSLMDSSDEDDGVDVFEKLRQLRAFRDANRFDNTPNNQNDMVIVEDDSNDIERNGKNGHVTSESNNKRVIESDSDNEELAVSKKTSTRRLLDSDEEKNEESDVVKRIRLDSSSDSEAPRSKRSRIIISDEEAD